MTSKYPFLSEEWIEAARAIYRSHGGDTRPAEGVLVSLNLVVEDVPFPPGRLDAHLDTTSGLVEIELGHLERADARVTLGYDTAQAVLVEGDGQAAMQAFMAGRIRIEGDLAALLGAFSSPSGPVQNDVGAALREITEASRT